MAYFTRLCTGVLSSLRISTNLNPSTVMANNVFEALFNLARKLCREGYYVAVNKQSVFEDSPKTLREPIETDERFDICDYSTTYGLVWAWPPFKLFQQLTVVAEAVIEDGDVNIYAYTKDAYDELIALELEVAGLELFEDDDAVKAFEFDEKTRKWMPI
jgi:hypothetical protein